MTPDERKVGPEPGNDQQNNGFLNEGGSNIREEYPVSIEMIYPDGREGFQEDGGLSNYGGTGGTQDALPWAEMPKVLVSGWRSGDDVGLGLINWTSTLRDGPEAAGSVTCTFLPSDYGMPAGSSYEVSIVSRYQDPDTSPTPLPGVVFPIGNPDAPFTFTLGVPQKDAFFVILRRL